ncbi:hypothetical protein SK128_025314, partial [Halocaridina rubra]
MNSLECSVCFQKYDEREHSPRCLTCGHTACSSCIYHLLGNRPFLKCPICRALHKIKVKTPQQIPLNYELVKLISKDNQQRGYKAKEIQIFQFVKQAMSQSTDEVYESFQALLLKLSRYQTHMEVKEYLHIKGMTELSDDIIYLVEAVHNVITFRETSQNLLKDGFSQLEKLKAHRKQLQDCETSQELVVAQFHLLQSCEGFRKWRTQEHVRHLENLAQNEK